VFSVGRAVLVATLHIKDAAIIENTICRVIICGLQGQMVSLCKYEIRCLGFFFRSDDASN
jgi:hypothetical protein